MREYSSKHILLYVLNALIAGNMYSQAGHPLFKKIPLDSMGVRCYEMLCAKDGSLLLTSSIGIWRLQGREVDGPSVGYSGEITDNATGKKNFIKNFRNYNAEDSIRAMAEGLDSIFFYATHDNIISYSTDGMPGVGWPPFVFPPKGKPFDTVSSLYIDNDGDLFIGTRADNFYRIQEGANKQSYRNAETKIVDSVVTTVKGEKQVAKIMLAPNTGVFSFAQDSIDKHIIWIGTNRGLFSYNKATAESKAVIPANATAGASFTVTHIEIDKQDNLWFSTLEKGMGFYYRDKNNIQFYPYPKKNSGAATVYPIKTFCYKSDNDFFVAVMDSFPAVFKTKNGSYAFIDDVSLKASPDNTTDIKVDKLGNLLVIKGGVLYMCKTSENILLASSIKPDSSLLAPFIRSIVLLNGQEVASTTYHPELLKELRLKYDQNSFVIYYDLNDFGDKTRVQFAWKIEGMSSEWVVMPMLNFDSANVAYIQDLKPGTYAFTLKVKVGNEGWRKQQAKMIINITPPFWQTVWFWLSISGILIFLIFGIIKLRVRAVRNSERVKAKHEKELLELEAKALRAQMNPHFIFNCLNSIKSLIQEHEEEKAINYLTTFSKLIRTLFNNADKKEISLFDEIETCRLYLRLEAMRFDAKFTSSVIIDDHLDLKSIAIPALIIQPFIENAVWHGIIPRNTGGHIELRVTKTDGFIEITIEDNGIGRIASRQNKYNNNLTHQSKGVNLTQLRLELDSLLLQRQATIETIDKKDAGDNATGTKVIIKIKEEL